jgi:hypothetical protein
MPFLVKIGNEVIGSSELESGDPPMGVASGRLVPTPAYASIQRYRIEHREHWVNIPRLTGETAGACSSSAAEEFKSSTSVLNSAKGE